MEEDQESLIYIEVDGSLREDVLDAKVVRELLDTSGHYVVLVKKNGRLEFSRSSSRER